MNFGHVGSDNYLIEDPFISKEVKKVFFMCSPFICLLGSESTYHSSLPRLLVY